MGVLSTPLSQGEPSLSISKSSVMVPEVKPQAFLEPQLYGSAALDLLPVLGTNGAEEV